MNSSLLNQHRILIVFLIGIFYLIALFNSPIGYDESKYYIVSKYIDMGRVAWMDIHPGSVGVHFYQLYDLWFDVFGNSFYSSRFLSLFLSIAAIVSILSLFRLLRINYYAILAWIIIYVLNPFFGYLNVLVSHVSITNSLLIITASCQIQLMLFLKQNHKTNKMIFIAIVAGISLASIILIRPYYLLGGIALFAFYSYHVFRAGRYKIFIIFLFSTFLTVFGSLYIQSVSEAKYNYFQSLPVLEEIKQPQNQLETEVQKTKVDKIESITKNIDEITKSTSEIKVVEKIEQKEESRPKERKIDLNLQLPSEIAHRLDTAYVMLGEASQLLKRILNPEVINPFFKQMLGYMVNPLFIFYFVGLFSIPFLARSGYKIEHLNVIKTILTLATVVILPLFAFRYLKNTSFTYLTHGISLISVIPVIVLSSIFNNIKSKNQIFEKFLLGFLAIIAIQSHIFHTPENYVHNPINNILKSQYAPPGNDSYSIRTAKKVAKIIDTNSQSGDMVLFDQYAPLVFSEVRAIPGIEMSIYDGFFDKKKWINVKTIYKHESNSVARSAREVLNYIENGEVPLIVTSGRTSKDLIEIIDGVYCQIHDYGQYKIYKICEENVF